MTKLEETRTHMRKQNLSWARDHLDQVLENANSKELSYLDFINEICKRI